MKTIFSIFGLLVVFLVMLSVEISGKPIFSHIYGVISPATKSAQNATQKFFSKSVDSTQTYSKKLFNNSEPRVRDAVKSKLSSTKKMVSEPAEKITDEEKKELDQLIKNH